MAETQLELTALKGKFTQELRFSHYGLSYMLMGLYLKFLSLQIISGISNIKRCYLHHIHEAKLVHSIQTGYMLMHCSHSKTFQGVNQISLRSGGLQILGIWRVSSMEPLYVFFIFFLLYSKTSPTLLQSFRRMLQHCFTEKPQKCFVDY